MRPYGHSHLFVPVLVCFFLGEMGMIRRVGASMLFGDGPGPRHSPLFLGCLISGLAMLDFAVIADASIRALAGSGMKGALFEKKRI